VPRCAIRPPFQLNPIRGRQLSLLPKKYDRADCPRLRRCVQIVLLMCSPDCMPMELSWNDWRDNLSRDHDRSALHELTGDSDCYMRRRKRNTQALLRTLGSPFVGRQRCKT